ncbi:hypothetical protein [Enterococcus sp. HY326]|uniref:hypothetical protein n=1 Tax=Enterococcus sp. HY326 TaxID=2971265 RepID=UPI00223ECF88|nr:hypothetical protein [Enterococcus sp. HY326]
MLKKSVNKGYILFEALVSLLVVGLIIFSLLPQIMFLFQKNQTISESIKLHQILYSETARNCRFEQVPADIEKRQVLYRCDKQNNQIRAEVEGYGQTIEVYREF